MKWMTSAFLLTSFENPSNGNLQDFEVSTIENPKYTPITKVSLLKADLR